MDLAVFYLLVVVTVLFLLTSYYVYVFEHLSVFSLNLAVICDYSILTL